MHLDTAKISHLRDFIQWARITTKQSASFSIDIWEHAVINSQTVEYNIWINTIISKRSSNIDELISMIPSIKDFCLQNMEVRNVA